MMTEAELVQAIQDKRTKLAETINSENRKQLEDDIAMLERELATLKPKRSRRTAFLDECAG